MAAEALSNTEIKQALSSLPGWKEEGDAIHKEFIWADFRQAMAFMVSVAFEAEQRNHHPELYNVYSRVSITLSTHDAGGRVTQKDIELAQAIERVQANHTTPTRS